MEKQLSVKELVKIISKESDTFVKKLEKKGVPLDFIDVDTDDIECGEPNISLHLALDPSKIIWSEDYE